VSGLDHDSPTALYQQLADVLRRQIESGKLTGRVPSAKSLSEEFEVAVGTAERALGILREAGFIMSAIGRGHFVVPPEQRDR
jgi:GntR family transcriptional regulator